MLKDIVYADTAPDKLLAGVTKLRNIVAPTLSPMGDNVAIETFKTPLVMHDGVTVAEEVFLEDPHENMGAQIVKESATKTNSSTGDGTTSAIILTHKLFELGLEKIKTGYKSKRLRKELEEALQDALGHLKTIAKPIKKHEEIEQIAIISAQDETLGKLVAEAIKKLGKNGVIVPEEGNGIETTVSYKEGMQFNQGYTSLYFVTNPETDEAILEDCAVFVTDKKLQSVEDMTGILEKLSTINKTFVIVAEDIVGDALAILAVNNYKGNIRAIGIKAPEFGKYKQQALEDIAALTNGKVFLVDSQEELSTFNGVGIAEKVTSTDSTTTILAKGDVSERIKDIEARLKYVDGDYDRDKLNERLARLTSGIAIISAGARTDVEMKEKKEAIIDAIASTKSAIEEGIVSGGATTYLELAHRLRGSDVGSNLLREALLAPFDTLISNAGLEKHSGNFKNGEGIDVMDGQVKNMIDSGIIDSAKVIRMVLENSVSTAGQLITTSGAIADVKTDNK